MKKFLMVISAIILTLIISTTEAKSGKYSSKYTYFTQDKNITNLNTQLPAQKGLLKKDENPQMKSVGNYQKNVNAPRTHLVSKISIYKQEVNRIALQYEYVPNDSQMNPRIPIYQQIFREDIPNTHVYFILPKEVIPIKERQAITAINNRTEKTSHLSACSPDDTKLAQLLRKYNASIEGTYDLTSSEETELEKAFDNTVDAIGGKVGKGIKMIKQGIKWGIKQDEKKRVEALRKKYGEEYQIYKMPFYTPEGISQTYTHIGRQSSVTFDSSKLAKPAKIFIEIPQITFTIDAYGATRKGSLEGLAYEVVVEPVRDMDNPVESMVRFAKQIFEAIKTEDRNKIVELASYNEEDIIDIDYLYRELKKENKKFLDSFPYVSQAKRDKILNSIPIEIKERISEEMPPFIQELRDELLANMEKFYMRYGADKINWSSAKYLRCFYNFSWEKLSIVFTIDNKEHLFKIDSILLPSGWKIIEKLSGVSTNTCIIMEEESDADIIPGKTKEELNIIKLQYAISMRDKVIGTWKRVEKESKRSIGYMEFRNDGTFSRDVKEAKGYEGAADGKYKVSERYVTLMGGRQQIYLEIKDNFLIDHYGAHWIICDKTK